MSFLPGSDHSRTMADMVIVSGGSVDSSMISAPSDEEGEDHDQLVPPPWFGESSDEIISDGEHSVTEARVDPIETFPSPPPSMTLAEAHAEIKQNSSPPPVVRGAPSWKEFSSKVLPAAAQELLSSSLRRVLHTARISYSRGRWHRRYSDLGQNAGGYFSTDTMLMAPSISNVGTTLPRFSCLSWVDRQLVQEWRTVSFQRGAKNEEEEEEEDQDDAHPDDEEDDDFDRARTLVPQPHPRPIWRKADVCHACHKPFGPTLLRHHCRLCGNSYCHRDSSWTHKLPHLGYEPDVPERVCDPCKRRLLEENLAERVAWRLARLRDYENGELTPYFETGVDTVEDAALRITQAAIAMARSIPLGAQAHVAVETVEVLRKHGLNGIYTLILRNEFLEAADLLCKALGINKTAWPLSVHELSAAIFYALAQHRAMRGMNPEREHLIHTFQKHTDGPEAETKISSAWTHQEASLDLPETSAEEAPVGSPDLSNRGSGISVNSGLVDETDVYDPRTADVSGLLSLGDSAILPSKAASVVESVSDQDELPFTPVCDAVPDEVISALLFYAPIALNFIYAEKEVDMQLLAAQQGWRLLYAHLQQDPGVDGPVTDRPAYALFVHEEQKIACVGVRGTATINDVVTDIRQIPVPFPETETDISNSGGARFDDDWTPVFEGQGLAVCGMARAAANLYRENIDVLTLLAQNGYRIRCTGHSLGGGVATLLGALVLRHFDQTEGLHDAFERASRNRQASGTLLDSADLLRVTAYGTPSCVDSKLAEYVKPFVTTVVLHDDVVPRLTPTSIRGLLKHLLHIRETWVRAHLADDLMAITERAKSAWAPRWRQSFTLSDKSAVSIKRYCRKQIQYGKRTLLSVKGKLVSNGEGEESESQGEEADMSSNDSSSHDETILVCDRTDGASHARKSDHAHAEVSGQPQAAPEPAMLVDYMGGVDIKAEGIIIDGDEFFDTEEALVESDCESVVSHLNDCRRGLDTTLLSCETNEQHQREGSGVDCSPRSPRGEEDSWVPFDEHGENVSTLNQSISIDSDGEERLESDESSPSPSAVMLEETPLPRMFLPGRVVHIYTHRGGYKAAYVPRAYRELRRISLAGNMLSDHLADSYFEALLEVRSVRRAQEGLPRWTAFDEDYTCSCCASRFTWASTSDTEAQEARDKHNCRSCGGLVCNPCSRKRVPLPSIGITVAVRVCDRCFNDIGGVLAETSTERPSSIAMDGHMESKSSKTAEEENETLPPERQRERRSHVVDELASRIQLTCS